MDQNSNKLFPFYEHASNWRHVVMQDQRQSHLVVLKRRTANPVHSHLNPSALGELVLCFAKNLEVDFYNLYNKAQRCLPVITTSN
eukprot:1156676-Pelagomonas_calceolata.AAC.2